jgi:hypothetical protein
MRLAAVAVCGLGLMWSMPGATAQQSKPQPVVEDPMQIYLVRSAQGGCEPQCPEWIAAQGKIETGSVARFRKVLHRLGDRKVPVLIDSSGGKVREAFAIGRLLRRHGLDVVVTSTVFTPCAPADSACLQAKAAGVLTGLPRARLSKCASSCAFILAAGTRRLVGTETFVGVHRVRSFYVYTEVHPAYRLAGRKRPGAARRVTRRMVETRTPPRTYRQIRRYFTEMGVGDPIVPLILKTPSDSLHWLTREELQASRLATEWIDGEQLLAAALVGAPPPSPPAPSGPQVAGPGER